MPELPEVETVRRSLSPLVVGARIKHVVVSERRLRRPLTTSFEPLLRNRRIQAIRRCGKYLLFDLSPPTVLLIHLGMSGTLEVRDAGQPSRLHDHVRIRLDHGRDMVFNDPRRFGLLRVGREDDLPELRGIALDPLSPQWSADYLHALTRRRRSPIKSLLMDQRTVAGIGNIYASEILHRAGVCPGRRAASLSRRESEALALAARAVLQEAIRLGGSSISDFRDATGQLGYFQLQLAVYARAGQPCRQCSTPIRCVVLSGRSSFYCPRCQR